jgi:hypothetical protein
VIQIFCPNCFKSVSVPDEAAGTSTACPSCGKDFPVPARYNPVVATPPPPPTNPPPTESPAMPEPPTPPPGYTPPAAPLEAPLPPEPPVPGAPPGYRRSVGFSVSPKGLAWVPAGALTVILLLTPVTWVGSYIGGSAVYSQSGWGALAGDASRNPVLEPVLRAKAPWTERVLANLSSDWPLILPYLLCLVLALVVAWAERLVADLPRNKLPPSLQWVAGVWPYRIPVLAGLATTALLLVVVQTVSGFGLERAMSRAVHASFAEAREQAAADTSAQKKVELDEDIELAKVDVQRTTWLYLVILLHLVVVLAMVGRAALERRGNRPPPRVVFQY